MEFKEKNKISKHSAGLPYCFIALLFQGLKPKGKKATEQLKPYFGISPLSHSRKAGLHDMPAANVSRAVYALSIASKTALQVATKGRALEIHEV